MVLLCSLTDIFCFDERQCFKKTLNQNTIPKNTFYVRPMSLTDKRKRDI